MNKLNTQSTIVEKHNQAQISRKEETVNMSVISEEINEIENTKKKLRNNVLKTSVNWQNFSWTKKNKKEDSSRWTQE